MTTAYDKLTPTKQDAVDESISCLLCRLHDLGIKVDAGEVYERLQESVAALVRKVEDK